MTVITRILLMMCLMSGTLLAQQAQVAELLSKDMPDFPGKDKGAPVVVPVE